MAEKKLKYTAMLDTAPFDKGTKQIKQGMRDMEGIGQNALGKIGDALGVNVGQLEKVSSAVNGVTGKLASMGESGAGSLGKIAASCTGVAGALAGIGIGAVIVAFKALNAEAENFKTRMDGINIAAAGKAYRDTYTQIMHDLNRETGKFWAEKTEEVSNAITRGFSNTKQFFMSGAVLDVLPGAGLITGGALINEWRLDKKTARVGAERSAEIESRLVDIEKELMALEPRLAQLRAERLEMDIESRSHLNTAVERQEAFNAAMEKNNEIYELQIGLIKERAALYKEQDDLAESTTEEVRKGYQLESEVFELQRDRDQFEKSLMRNQKTIANLAEAEAKERQKSAEAVKKVTSLQEITLAQAKQMVLAEQEVARVRKQNAAQMERARQELAGGVLERVDISTIIPQLDMAGFATIEQEVSIVPRLDEEAAQKTVLDLSNIVEGGINTLGESIGGLIGDLVTGGDAWGNFASSALAAFADMAIAVGRIAIAAGMATEAVKASLETLGGWGAIAAGVALVALGTAVKAGMQNVAAGNYSAGASVANSAYRSASVVNSPDMQRQAMNIEVTGTLEARGDALVAVIDNNRKKRLAIT